MYVVLKYSKIFIHINMIQKLKLSRKLIDLQSGASEKSWYGKCYKIFKLQYGKQYKIRGQMIKNTGASNKK